MEACEIGHHHSPHHDVVEMGDHEISIVDMGIDRQRSQAEPGQPAHREEPDETENIEQRGIEPDPAIVERRRPVEDLHRRGNRDQETEQRKDHSRIERLAADEHMVSPHHKPQQGDGKAGKGDEFVAEDAAAAEAGHYLADHPHAWQNHDVDRRMAVEPEEMLEEQGIASGIGIENGDAAQSFQRDQEQSDRQDRCRQHHDEAGRIKRPDEERQPEPPHSAHPQGMDRDDEIESGEDRREAVDEDSSRHHNDIAIRIGARIGRIERPARIGSSQHHRGDHQRASEHVDIPARQVQAGKGEILCPDHQRQEKIPQHVRDRGDEEKPDHDDAVKGEKAVVGFRGHQLARRTEEIQPHQQRGRTADGEEEADRKQVEDRDSLVIPRQQPGAKRAARIQVILLAVGEVGGRFHGVEGEGLA